MRRPPAESVAASVVRPEGRVALHRTLAEEVPVAIVFDGSTQAVLMATPQDLSDLAVGFALTEGIVGTTDEILGVEEIEHDDGIEVRLSLREAEREALAARRRAMAGPVGCGLCGIESLAEAVRSLPPVAGTGPRFAAADLTAAVDALGRAQPLHDQTRATHAAGFFRPGEGLVLVREDVGRHNALDKVIGALARAGTPAGEGGFAVTSRLSVELVQKVVMAGASLLVGVSAPTAHAVRLAGSAGLTLAASVRGPAFELHTRPDRVVAEVAHVA